MVEHFVNERNLFVISSDFCHWGQRFGFTHKYEEFKEAEIHKSIEKLDKVGMGHIESQDLPAFQNYLDQTQNSICGQNPIQLLLSIINEAAKENYGTQFLKYDQSEPVTSM